MKRFYGKYRGKVESNIDPLFQGRIQVSVPAVLGGSRMAWAMPCTPYAGPGVGLVLVPPVGANVWVEFEGGAPDKAIYSGGFWGLGEMPPAPLPQMKVLKLEGITITLNEVPGIGGVTIEVNPPVSPVPMKLVFGPTGIEISHAPHSVKLSPVGVSVNNGALEVI